MRSAIVVEVDCQSYGCNDFSDTPEDFALEQFILHRIVQALGLGIVFWIS